MQYIWFLYGYRIHKYIVFTCGYIYIYKYMYVYVCICVICVCMHVSMYTYIYIWLWVHHLSYLLLSKGFNSISTSLSACWVEHFDTHTHMHLNLFSYWVNRIHMYITLGGEEQLRTLVNFINLINLLILVTTCLNWLSFPKLSNIFQI